MPNTYTSLHYHIVFSTRNREPWISRDWHPRLFEYLGGALRGLGAHSHEVGGVADHVHLLVSLKPTHMIAKVLQELKKASSVWVHEEMNVPEFAWQDGYAPPSMKQEIKEMNSSHIHTCDASLRGGVALLNPSLPAEMAPPSMKLSGNQFQKPLHLSNNKHPLVNDLSKD